LRFLCREANRDPEQTPALRGRSRHFAHEFLCREGLLSGRPDVPMRRHDGPILDPKATIHCRDCTHSVLAESFANAGLPLSAQGVPRGVLAWVESFERMSWPATGHPGDEGFNQRADARWLAGRLGGRPW
jgi:hypothetical protein